MFVFLSSFKRREGHREGGFKKRLNKQSSSSLSLFFWGVFSSQDTHNTSVFGKSALKERQLLFDSLAHSNMGVLAKKDGKKKKKKRKAKHSSLNEIETKM